MFLIVEIDSSKSFPRPDGDDKFPTPDILMRPWPVSTHRACFELLKSDAPMMIEGASGGESWDWPKRTEYSHKTNADWKKSTGVE